MFALAVCDMSQLPIYFVESNVVGSGWLGNENFYHVDNSNVTAMDILREKVRSIFLLCKITCPLKNKAFCIAWIISTMN